MSKGQAGLLVGVAYLAAAFAALVAGYLVRTHHPLLVAAVADLAATVVVFGFSARHRNSSVYDPYWSLAPLPIGLYFGLEAAFSPRLLIALVLVTVWSVRLTYNWWRRWKGMEDEDWRYVDIAKKTGRLYWPVSFLGIHLFPTILVYLGCLPLWAAANAGASLGPLDLLAFLVTIGAILIEAVADRQLRAHVCSEQRDQILDRGLWRYSRHPNYLGELMLWWGLFLFALAAGEGGWWIWLGPLAMTGLFLLVSIPMVEKRSLARRPAYRAYAERTPVLVPLLGRRRPRR